MTVFKGEQVGRSMAFRRGWKRCANADRGIAGSRRRFLHLRRLRWHRRGDGCWPSGIVFDGFGFGLKDLLAMLAFHRLCQPFGRDAQQVLAIGALGLNHLTHEVIPWAPARRMGAREITPSMT